MRHMKFEEMNSHVPFIGELAYLEGWGKVHLAGFLCYNIPQYYDDSCNIIQSQMGIRALVCRVLFPSNARALKCLDLKQELGGELG